MKISSYIKTIICLSLLLGLLGCQKPESNTEGNDSSGIDAPKFENENW